MVKNGGRNALYPPFLTIRRKNERSICAYDRIKIGLIRNSNNYLQEGKEHGATRECVVNSTGKYAVTNGVYERGYRYASLAVKSQSGSGTAKGVWSPDCAGSYTILN